MTDDVRKQNFLACLSDPSRFSLIATLCQGPQCVTELAVLVGLSQSCTTRHLQALLREGIVTSHREGKRVVFEVRVAGPEAHPVLSWAFGGSAKAPPPLGTTRTRPSGDHAATPRRPRAEVTDALIVAHDSAWASDDATAGNGSSRPPARDTEAGLDPATETDTPVDPTLAEDFARSTRSQLDDFLL